MKILLTTKDYLPTIGGLQTMARVLALGFQKRGHDVTILTQESTPEKSDQVIHTRRRPGIIGCIKTILSADIILLNHISIRYGLLAIFLNKPFVVSMSGWVGRKFILNKIFRWILKRATANIAACAAIKHENRTSAHIIPNPYYKSAFFNKNYECRPMRYTYAGRLVSDKGIKELIYCWHQLINSGMTEKLHVVGLGDLQKEIEAYVAKNKLNNYIIIYGGKTQDELSDILNQSVFYIIPSIWQEPIGITCLEAIACGCVPISSNTGGLPESVGPCGLIFDPTDPQKFTEVILRTQMLSNTDIITFQSKSENHLQKFSPDLVCDAYLNILTKAHLSYV